MDEFSEVGITSKERGVVCHRFAVSPSQFLSSPILRVSRAVIHDTLHLMIHQGCDHFKNSLTVSQMFVTLVSHPCTVAEQ